NNAAGNNRLRVRLFPARTDTLGGDDNPAQTGSIVAWGAQLEKRPYPTTYIRSPVDSLDTRAAESFYATLPQPLPQEFTAFGIFLPDWASTVARPGAARIVTFEKATPSANDYLALEYDFATDTFRFVKVVGGSSVTLSSAPVSFNAGDPVRWRIAQDSAGMHLSVKVGAAAAAHTSNTNTDAFATD